MRVTLDGKRSEINIGRTVEPEKWHAKSEKMLGRSIEANDLNDYIELMRIITGVKPLLLVLLFLR